MFPASSACRLKGMVCFKKGTYGTSSGFSVHDDEVKAKGNELLDDVRHSLQTAIHEGLLCTVLQRWDTHVQAGRVDRRHAGYLASTTLAKLHATAGLTVLGHVAAIHQCEQGANCLLVLLNWGTCPHNAGLHMYSHSHGIYAHATPFRHRRSLTRERLDLLLASGCPPVDLVGWIGAQLLMATVDVPDHATRMCDQWHRWHGRHCRRYWAALAAC